MLEQILENYPDDSFLKLDGFDDAILGVDEKTMILIYSVSKILEILYNQFDITQHDLDEYDILTGYTVEDKKREMALEYFDFNINCAYMGEKTPILCFDNF
jgi:hypothetical protein